MLLVNLSGGPGSGKSTTAAYIFAELKMSGYKAELVGEEAKDLVYNGAIPMLENQVLILGQQWQRITRLERSGAEVAICDSPLVLSILYSQSRPYLKEITEMVRCLEGLFPDTFNINVRRVKQYVKFGRYQEEEQAKALDQQAMSLLKPLHLSVPGDRAGAIQASEAIIDHLREVSYTELTKQ